MKGILAAIMAAAAMMSAAPTATAATICTETGGFKCYCSGLGCRRFCRDIIVLGGGGGSSAPAAGVASTTLAAGPAAEELEIAGLFRGLVSVRAPGFTGRARAVAVVGPAAEVDAGRGRLFVASPGGPAREVGLVDLDAVTVADRRARLSLAGVRDGFARGGALSD